MCEQKWDKIKNKDSFKILKEQLDNPCMSNRIHKENTRRRIEGEYQRDFARIMYSSSFRRLQGKMQLLGIKSDEFFRNRLTHSLEVAQIARSIAGNLDYNQNEIFVVEAGALAHDIGNPPFGHAGEEKLNKLYSKIGGYEGNAQTLRILTTVEKKKPGFQGLNLTYRTMLSVVKYFNKNTYDVKKFLYDDDYDMLKTFIDENQINVRTLDVQIVDLADEIAYAAHDLEDGLRTKAFNINEVLHDFYAEYKDSNSCKKLEECVDKAMENSGYKKGKFESSEYSKMFAQELSSIIIHELIEDIDVININGDFTKETGTMNKEELGFGKYGELAEGLKKIVFRCINHNNKVFFYEKKGNKLLRCLSEFYEDNTNLLPPEYRADNIIKTYSIDTNKKKYQKRLICDFISGMMDSYAINTYESIFGKSFDSILGGK